MDSQRQYETLVVIKAYAKRIVDQDQGDLRPSTAKFIVENILRMHRLAAELETRS